MHQMEGHPGMRNMKVLVACMFQGAIAWLLSWRIPQLCRVQKGLAVGFGSVQVFSGLRISSG